MKILVSMPNFGTHQLHYLQMVVDEFKTYDAQYSIDVVVHSNVDVQIDGIEQNIIKHLDNWWKLPFIARKTIVDRCDDYDLYIFNENDQLITQENIETFLKINSVLPQHYLVGFVQYEIENNRKYFPAFHIPFKWIKNSQISFDEYTFARHQNCHQASFVLTHKQLTVAMKNLNFNRDNKVSRYNDPERVGTDIYHCSGFTKLICISHFDKLLIHHLPDKYLAFGEDERMVDCAIKKFIDRNEHSGNVHKKIQMIVHSIERFSNRYAYNNIYLGKIRREIARFCDTIRKIFKIKKNELLFKDYLKQKEKNNIPIYK
jgi:hypothetical protein